MCTNYTPTSRDRLRAAQLGVAHLPPAEWPSEVFPGYEAPILVRGGAPGQHDLAPRCLLARFGLVPRWSRDAAHARELSRHTTNARSETAAVKPSFRGPWRDRHWALAPMENFFEPCWETGHAVRWRIARADGDLFAAAGLWERWTDPASGEITASFTLLTVNADVHPLMARMHRPGDETYTNFVSKPGIMINQCIQALFQHRLGLMCHLNKVARNIYLRLLREKNGSFSDINGQISDAFEVVIYLQNGNYKTQIYGYRLIKRKQLKAVFLNLNFSLVDFYIFIYYLFGQFGILFLD